MSYRLSLLTAGLLLAGTAQAGHLEEITVHAERQRVVLDKSNLTVAMPDTAELMRRIPGGGVNKNGALSGIPQYRGLFGARVHVQADSLAISPGGPNWMDPPLHYTPAALLEQFTVYRGIAPVSAGQETIGGAIHADTWQGHFTDAGQWQSQGRLYAGAQSNNDGWVTALSTALSNHRHKLRAALLSEAGNDQQAVDADLLPTEYERRRYDLGYSLRAGNHQFSLDASRNQTEDSGTPALPMDILYIDGDNQKLHWQYQSGDWQLAAQVASSHIDHGMSNYHLRQSPADSGKWRRNDTGSDTDSARFSIRYQQPGLDWQFGLDHHDSVHFSRITNPNNALFYVNNFNDASRMLTGLFVESHFIGDGPLELELGLRATRAVSDAGTVNTSMAMMNPMVATLRDRFNSSQQDQADELYDAVAKLSYALNDSTQWYGGLARKSRAPSYQERYLWLPMQATAGLADGNNHVGNIELQPEVAHELELGFDLSRSGLWLSPRLFWKQVDDYIQGVPTSDMAVVMVSTMMGGDATPLAYANTSARLYGADLEWSWAFRDNWNLAAIASAIRGERRDIDDDLYRIAPVSMTLSLTYGTERWSASLINELQRAQQRVSTTNEEQETAGYGLLHLHADVRLAGKLTLALGINNLLDKAYRDHLSGYNRAANPDLALGERLPGTGRDGFARLRWEW